ncbi:MAG TPA: M24 family metallopeptidase [Patescibacteria group bacterium]|nr:M24 family metallopeptidase [Patescibacteria group bacterium]
MRIKAFQKTLNLSILLKNKQDLRYLLGKEVMHGFLLLKPKKDAVFFGDGLEKVPVTSDRFSNIQKYLGKAKQLGVDSELNLGEQVFLKSKLKGVSLLPVSRPLKDFRVIKESHEIKHIAAAQKITGKVFALVLKELRTRAHTELSLARFIKIKGLELGVEDVSFPPIVAAGKNAAIPHHCPSKVKLKKGQSIILDFGFKIQGYCSDFTRTVFLKTVPSKLKMYYEQTEQAYYAGIAAVKPQVSAAQVHETAAKVLAEKSLDRLFIHSLGHGIGLNIHEPPAISPYSKDVLNPGMVFSIEPGVYDSKAGGIRIEDLFVIKNNKAEQLSSISVKLADMVI